LILLHGFCGHPRSWDRTVAHVKRPRTIAAPYLPGHAGSNVPLVSFDQVIDQLAADLRSSSLWPAHVVGYSLGGRLACALVTTHPELVYAATLISTHFGLQSDAERAARRAQDERWIGMLRRDGLEKFVDAWQGQPLFASQAELAPELLDGQRSVRLSHSAQGLARALKVLGLAEMPDYAQALSRVGVPVTLVVGERDQKFLALARTMVERLARGQLRVIFASGHNPLLEAPEALAAVLDEGM